MNGAYPRLYREITDLARGTVLTTAMARAIARKGLVPQPFGGTSALGLRLLGQWSLVAGIRTPEGFAFDYPEGDAEFVLPTGTDPYQARRYADSRAFGEGRLVVNVEEAGVSGSSLAVFVEEGSFVGSAPSCPLDETGLHVSDWADVLLPEDADPEDSVLVSWVVANPSTDAGSGKLGTCQFMVR